MFKTITMNDKLYKYLLTNSLREDKVLQALREETATMVMAEMQISPEQGQLMNLLAKLIGAKKVLEVGVFTGYSSISVARALPEDGILIACDKSEEWTNVAKRYWQQAGVAHKIDLRLASAVDTLQDLVEDGQQNSFDMAFIDADKSNYPHYYELVLQLLRPGGLLLIDNVLWDGKVADQNNSEKETEMFRQLNRKVQQDDRVDMSMLPVGDGLTLCVKR